MMNRDFLHLARIIPAILWIFVQVFMPQAMAHAASNDVDQTLQSIIHGNICGVHPLPDGLSTFSEPVSEAGHTGPHHMSDMSHCKWCQTFAAAVDIPAGFAFVGPSEYFVRQKYTYLDAPSSVEAASLSYLSRAPPV